MNEISVDALKRKRDAGESFVLLDVREPFELAIASLPDTLAIPMGDIPDRMTELATSDEIVVMCHHGSRSAHVTQFLNANGYPTAVNLAGGIDAWSASIDESVPRY